MLIFFTKSQLSLFDTPVHIGAHVRKDGTVVKPHIRIQKVAVKQRTAQRQVAAQPVSQPSLFGGESAPSASKPRRSKLDGFIARHGGPKALAATIMGFAPHQQSVLLEQMAKVGGLEVEKLREVLGLGAAAPAQEAVKPEPTPIEAEAAKPAEVPAAAKREPFAAGVEPQKNGSVLVLGDAAKLEAYGLRFLDIGLYKYKLDARGLVLPKARARMAESFPVEREALPSGAHIEHYPDGVSVSFDRELSFIARNVPELKKLLAENWGSDKFQKVFGESAPADAVQAHAEQQAAIAQRKKENEAAESAARLERARKEGVTANLTDDEREILAKEKVAHYESLKEIEAQTEAKWRETVAHGQFGNVRYQAYLDTLENPLHIGRIGVSTGYMGWVHSLVDQFVKETGRKMPMSKGEESEKWAEDVNAYIRQHADANLSERVKAQRAAGGAAAADTGPRDGERNADGLVFRNGRWHREDEAAPAADAVPQPEAPAAAAPAIIEYTTKKGKVLRGIVRADLSGHDAAAIDPYTFRYQGGWFIREKHLTGATVGAAPAAAAPVEQPDPEAAARASAAAAVEKSKAQAAKLREAGEKLLAESESEYGRDRNTNTARRVRMAASAEAAAAEQIRIAKTMINLASAIEDGDARYLAGVNSKVAVQTLESEIKRAMQLADKDLPYADQQRNRGRSVTDDDIAKATIMRPKWGTAGTSLSAVLDAIKGKRGAPALAAKLRASDGPTPELAVELRKVVDAEKVKSLLGWWNMERLQEINRLQKLGITNDEQLREALREFVQYRAGHKPVDPVKAAERALVGQKVGVDFFPTPKTLSAAMAEAAGITAGMRVLEPSAGNGHLADAAKAAGADVDTVEISDTLRNILQAKGHNLVGRDFESFDPVVQYDAVLMNPPFSDRKDAAHIMRAWNMLKPGGKMVAIAGEGVFFGSDAKARVFRQWLETHGAEVEQLPPGTFLGADLPAQTSANARLIKVTKPAQAEALPAVDEEVLRDVGLLYEVGGQWKYKFSADGKFLSANSKEDAVERATKTYHETPPEKRLTADQRYDAANAAEYESMHQRYGHMSMERLEAMHAKLGGDISSLRAAGGVREMTASGGRSTSRAVANEGARDAAEERMKLGRYIDERKKRDGGAVDQDTGPKEGDRNADGLVFRDGRWHREDEAEAVVTEAAPAAKLEKVEAVRAGDVFRAPNGEAITVMRQLPGGKCEVRIQGKRTRLGDFTNSELKQFEKIGRADYADGSYTTPEWMYAPAAEPEPAAAPTEADLAEDREDLATELTRNPHSDKAKAMLAAAAERHAKADAPAGDDEDDPNSPNYRFADTGYIAGSRKEEAAANVIQRAKRDGAQVMVQHIDWDGLEQNQREAKELITKSNLFGQVPWGTLREGGMEPGAGFLIDRIYASIGQEPTDDNAQARKDYTLGLQTLRSRMESCKTAQQVTEVLDELREEYDGKVLNAEESAAYEKISAAADTIWKRLREVRNEGLANRKKYLASIKDYRDAEDVSEKRKRRNWKPDPEIEAKLASLKPAYEATVKEYQEKAAAIIEEERALSGQVTDLNRMMEKVTQMAYARNKIENPLHRAWMLMGERFINVMRFRSFDGSEAFAKHVTAARQGLIKDWSWAEKEGATKAPKVKKEAARFQMKVVENHQRVGGRAVTVDSTMALKNHFGLRDVQSGNWVLKDPESAKFHVEQTAAAFADLADLIGIPDEQVSFNGRLAMAFGARGKGNTGFGGAAAAHYEPVHRVINMTKMRGGGSLAHEWLHAVDNLLKEAEGHGECGVDDFITERPDLLPPGPLRDAFVNLRAAMMDGEHQLTSAMQYTAADYRLAKHNLDRSVLGSLATKIKQAPDAGAALAAIAEYYGPRMDIRGAKKQRASWERIAIAWHGGNPDGGEIVTKHGPKMSLFMKEAHLLDGGSRKSYYSQTKEMAARAFQSWVEDRLAGMGRRNDYLSWGADNKYHVDPLLGIEWKPFPEGPERERINAAFDNLMAVLGEQKVLAKALGML